MIGTNDCMIRWQGTLSKVAAGAVKSYRVVEDALQLISDLRTVSAKMRQKCLAISGKKRNQAKIASKSANLLNWPKVCYYNTVLSLMRSDKYAVVIGGMDFAW
jgi:hypothetical protein